MPEVMGRSGLPELLPYSSSSDHNREVDPGESPVNIPRRAARARASCLCCAAVAGQNPIRADHLCCATSLSMFGLLDYRGWPHRRLHSPRAERMREKIAVTPSARSVQTEKPPLDLAIPTPVVWMTGMADVAISLIHPRPGRPLGRPPRAPLRRAWRRRTASPP